MANNDNHNKFIKILDNLLSTIWKYDPVNATSFGIHEFDNTFGDTSKDGYEQKIKVFRDFINKLQLISKIDIENSDFNIDYHLALSLASTNYLILEQQRYWENNPASYAILAVWGCYGLLVRDFAPIEERTKSLLGRMREIPDLLNNAISNMLNPPAVFIKIASEIIKGGITFFENSIPLLSDKVTSFRDELLKTNTAVINSLRDFDRRLNEELLPKADENFALGSKGYEQLLFSQHYLTYSPNDISLIGARVLDETKTALNETAKSIDSSSTWQEIIDRLKNEHPSADNLLNEYNRAVKSCREFLIEHDIVSMPDVDILNVEDTPEFDRGMIPYAAYLPPAPFEAVSSGHFYVTPVDRNASLMKQDEQLMGNSIYSIPITALHEAYPGHHLQLSRAANSGTPITKATSSSLMAEGWAMYCEDMMYEQGFYSDPRIRLFQLKNQLWRACRVIIDTGIHTGDMTFDEAVRMLVETAKLEEINAIAEVKRYTMSPTQPMTYIIGKLLFLDLRNKFKLKCKDSYNLKAFHDAVLDCGTIPPPLISRSILNESIDICWSR